MNFALPRPARRPILVSLFALVLAGGVAACSSGSGGSSSSSPAAPTSASSSTPAPSSSSASTPAGGGSSAGSSADSSTPDCTGAAINVSAVGDPSGSGAGHSGLILRFINTAATACALSGYPGADALNASGAVLAHAARGNPTTATVTLAPGATASAKLGGSSDGSPMCTATSIVVTPPNTQQSTPLAIAPGACGLTVTPVVSGPNG
jgi:hypothetical protein